MTKVPTYPLIDIHCQNMGSFAYYLADEYARARSVNAPRDTYAAGSVNGEIQIRRWSELPVTGPGQGVGTRERLQRQCIDRYGVDPATLA